MKYFFYFFNFFFILIPPCVQATIVPLKDRLLFSQMDKEKRLLIVNNERQGPVLLQSWIDNGSAENIEKEKNYPFVVIPAVARMAPGKIINLRIMPTPKLHDLPVDRESVFWINLFEIPGIKKSQEAGNASRMEVGLNTQIKIIYRPFKGGMDINRTGEAIKIRLAESGRSLELDNPTPYYVTPVSVKVKSSSAEQSVKLGMSRMIAPFAHKNFLLKEVMTSRKMTVDYTLIDDAGKEVSFTKTLN
ncbi:molecular chaperone [Pantoea stewartii]|uniref:fimbrial biogenesis chaperone n=1 Tax=Pantoea stewartii TaxID=66269 RepID=UPI0019803168|nr:molecular chaperone [Pantoea stewartii]